MPQIFRPSHNTIAKVSIFGTIAVVATIFTIAYTVSRTSYYTGQGQFKSQEVPFSHQHHVKGLGIDCRYCHTSVENSSFAGIPPVKTCMTCHSQIWTNAALLAPVREAYKTGHPLKWQRVHQLPDYVYFNHSIHVNKGVACTVCHGPVGEMPLMYQANSLEMKWCLECHRNPAKFIRPRAEVFNVDYQATDDQEKLGEELTKKYHVQSLTNCSTCHR